MKIFNGAKCSLTGVQGFAVVCPSERTPKPCQSRGFSGRAEHARSALRASFACHACHHGTMRLPPCLLRTVVLAVMLTVNDCVTRLHANVVLRLKWICWKRFARALERPHSSCAATLDTVRSTVLHVRGQQLAAKLVELPLHSAAVC